MDAIAFLYGTSRGRLRRRSFWLGLLGLVVASLVINLALTLAGFGIDLSAAGLDLANPDMAAMVAAAEEARRAGLISAFVTFGLLAWPAYNLAVKRQHDRNGSGRDVLAYLILSAVMLAVHWSGIGMYSMLVAENVTFQTPSALLNIANFALAIFGLYVLVACGFLPGTKGPNHYGPDPRETA